MTFRILALASLLFAPTSLSAQGTLTVTADTSFDCAAGRIDQPIALDANGAFDVTGTFTFLGNTNGADHSAHAAEYTGIVSGTDISITVTLLDQVDQGEAFMANLGAMAHIVAC